MKIFIVIPVYNRLEFTKNCLLSLRKQSYKNFKVIVIDDGSTDGTEEILKNEFPEVHVIKGDGNLWWTAATNLGVKYALENNAEYILTLNNDTIAFPDFLEKMIYWAEQKPNALLGAFAVDYNSNNPVYGGEKANWKFATAINLLKILPIEKQFGLHAVTHFPGRGLLIPTVVFKKIGLYDEKYLPHYAADYDFTFKAKKYGFEIYCNYDAKIFIYPEASGDKQNRLKRNLTNYYNHLFGIKGGGNLKNIYFLVVRYCPKHIIPLSLSIAFLRRIFGYWKPKKIMKN